MNNIDTHTIEGIRNTILNNNKFVIITHTNPDGDAIGSSLAWDNVLKNMGKTSHVILPNDCPDFLKWINGTETITLFSKKRKQAIEFIKDAEVIIFVDFNKLDRIEDLKRFVTDGNKTKLLIDHHPSPDNFVDYMISDSSASSASELVYQVMERIGIGEFITKEAAEAIYIGIITDTGGLTHNSSNVATYETIAKLLGKNIDKIRIHENTFNVHSADRMMLLGKVLSQNLKIFPEYNAAYMFISKEDQKKYNFSPGDSEGFVNYPLSIKGIKFSALFTENDDVTKVSLRSKDFIPANKFSEKHFNGGGHLNAAGGRIKTSLMDAIKIFEDGLQDFNMYLNETTEVDSKLQ